MNITGKCLSHSRQVLKNCRNLHVTRFVQNAAAYEGPGKTTITFLSKEISSRLLVMQSDELGFTLNTGTQLVGPTVIFPRHAICWNVKSGKHINDATLSLFTVLDPKPDLLIIGLDDKYDFVHIRNLHNLMRKHNLTTEITSVNQACKIFNFANEEGRYVVAALIPEKIHRAESRFTKYISANQTNSSDVVNSKTDITKAGTK